MSQQPRLTLIACGDAHRPDWSDHPEAAARLAFLNGDSHLRVEVLAALSEPTLDAERLILDRAATADAFLDVLASLPPEFSGDVLRIDDSGGGFLSAAGRGGDRVLYRLRPDDVRFYLEMIA
jgi:hypothetical protein